MSSRGQSITESLSAITESLSASIFTSEQLSAVSV